MSLWLLAQVWNPEWLIRFGPQNPLREPPPLSGGPEAFTEWKEPWTLGGKRSHCLAV